MMLAYLAVLGVTFMCSVFGLLVIALGVFPDPGVKTRELE